MTRIIIDVALKRQVEELHRLWGQQLPRQPGQLGDTVISWMEGQRIGNTVELFFNAEFLPTLRTAGVPFNE